MVVLSACLAVAWLGGARMDHAFHALPYGSQIWRHIHAFSLSQHLSLPLQAEIRIVYADAAGAEHATTVATSASPTDGWQGYDANAAYSPSQQNSGCSW